MFSDKMHAGLNAKSGSKIIKMSIEDFEFRAKLENRLSSLSGSEKIHSLYRVAEKLRLVHNVVGGMTKMRKDMTVKEFQVAHPILYSKLAPELVPFVVKRHLSKEGWDYFIDNIFDPREVAIMVFIGDIKRELMTKTSLEEIDPLE